MYSEPLTRIPFGNKRPPIWEYDITSISPYLSATVLHADLIIHFAEHGCMDAYQAPRILYLYLMYIATVRHSCISAARMDCRSGGRAYAHPLARSIYEQIPLCSNIVPS